MPQLCRLKSFSHQWLKPSHDQAIMEARGSRPCCMNCADLNTELGGSLASQIWTPWQPLPCALPSLRKGDANRWVSKPLLGTPGSPQWVSQMFFRREIAQSITYRMYRRMSVKLEEGRGLGPTQQGWRPCSLHSAFLVTLCCPKT